MKRSILILGGTAEAKALGHRLASRSGYEILLSLAGRTRTPAEQPVPVRIGGFGGAQGLADFIRETGIDLLIDATHPFAARISRNAAEAAMLSGVQILALRRPAWSRQAGDRWQDVANIAAAVTALDIPPRRIFLTLGRQELLPFEAAPQHHYLIRSVDPVEPPLAVPNAAYLTSRGPFAEAEEARLLKEHGIEMIVAKNSGGPSSYGKIAAARALGIDVILIRQPDLPKVSSFVTIDDLLALLDDEPDHAPAAPLLPLK